MKQLNSLDQQFLAVENSTHTGHVGGLYVLEPSPEGPVRVTALRELVAARLHLLVPLRRKLMEVPMGLDRPYWVDVEKLDLDAHVREHALAAPGAQTDLDALVALLHAQPLDRARPLWELHLINGLADGRQAVFGKVHHAVVDGISAGALLGALLDRSSEPPDLGDPFIPPAGLIPRRRHLVGRALANAMSHPSRSMRKLPGLLPHLHKMRSADRVPRTPFNAPISSRRAVAFGSVPVAEVRAIRSAYGCTDNDVVLALCATLLRSWLSAHHALPIGPLVIGVPVSLRAPRAAEGDNRRGGNQLSLVIVPLPTHLADPVERLNAIAAAMLAAKRGQAGMPATWLTDVTDLLPPALTGVTTRSIGRVLHRARRHPVNLVISNVPGPHVPLYLAGARMVAHYPVSGVSDALGGLNITVIGHDGDLDFGFVACPDLVPDVATLAAGLPAALAELRAAIAAVQAN